MKNIIIYFSLLLFSSSTFSQNMEKKFTDQNFIEVTGTAEMEIIPDIIKITIFVNETDFKTKQAFTEYENRMIGTLKEIGISIDNELTILNMNSRIKVSLIGKDNTFTSKQYQVIVNNTTKANLVFEAMEKIGITSIAITGFDHSEIQKLRLQVKINAIKSAKDKAIALTEAINQSIGKALYINEINEHFYKPGINKMMQSNVMLDNDLYKYKVETDQLNFQKIKLSYSVLVRFELH